MAPISEVQNEIWAEMAREETLKIGRREGRQEGRREGRQESRLETAHNMLKGGMSLDDVLRFTGLSREQLAEN
jgi:predicted transposase/invertase (TIGR01784 family)